MLYGCYRYARLEHREFHRPRVCLVFRRASGLGSFSLCSTDYLGHSSSIHAMRTRPNAQDSIQPRLNAISG